MRPDGSPNFDLNGLGQGITFQLPPNTDGEIWIVSVQVIHIVLSKFETSDFITK